MLLLYEAEAVGFVKGFGHRSSAAVGIVRRLASGSGTNQDLPIKIMFPPVSLQFFDLFLR